MNNNKEICVLVVDDSKLSRQYLVDFLKTKDFKILEAGDGKEALEILTVEKPDIILLDLIMPIMDGFKTLENLQKLGNRIPVIVVTIYIKDNTYIRCKELGASGFLNKPVKMHELYNMISSFLENPINESNNWS